mmetsp:Transcript_30067/g.95884  ORF Transcript_30067/g.95884 Transcript_30067/m.95884 type:complete len:87 (+) Transcript_30067:2184-2444(+)
MGVAIAAARSAASAAAAAARSADSAAAAAASPNGSEAQHDARRSGRVRRLKVLLAEGPNELEDLLLALNKNHVGLLPQLTLHHLLE